MQKKVFLVILLVGILTALVGALLPLFSLGNSEQTVGIIGGADTPTYLLRMQQFPSSVLFPAGIFLALAGAVGLFVSMDLIKRRRK